MNVYLSEDEQVEQIKQWLKKYGSSIITGILLGFAIMYGWQYWQTKQTVTVGRASSVYNQMLAATKNKQTINLKANAEELISQYQKTPYAIMARLTLAQSAIADNNIEEAKNHLMWVIENSETKAFAEIARVRLARLLLASNQPKEALTILEKVEDKAFTVLINEIKGDIFLAMGQKEEAKKAYQQALSEEAMKSFSRPLLSMKLNNLDVSEGDKV